VKKILLTILPYWSPVIPPVGLAALKSFLQPHGYQVKTVDMVAKMESLQFYYGYFNVLREYIPEEKRGNFFNIGHDVLQTHMMAHLNYKDEGEYIELVKLVIYNHYYVRVSDDCIRGLNHLIEDFYRTLRRYFIYLLDHEKPDLLGITVYKATLPASLFILALTKETYPHIKTVIGGGIFSDSHAVGTPNFEKLLQVTAPYLDKIFIGQGELLLLEYLRGRLPENQRVYTLKDLKSGPLGFEDLNLPDFSDFNIYKYGYLAATASSSCMYRCTFCNDAKYWGKFKKKEISRTVSEMMTLNQKYHRQLFFMTDSLLNPVIKDLAKEIIKKKATLYYDAYFRIDDASTRVQNTSLWRRGGLYRVRVGAESGSQRILDEMGKGITVEQIKTALTCLAYSGIKTTTYWVIGHPGETEEDFQKTLDLVEQLKDSIWQAECNPFRYYPGGQNSSDQWDGYRVPLYPGKAKDMILFDEWTLNLEPTREETYRRVTRFVRHCQNLGIPNPYSTNETSEADKRWRRLHKNAVPPMVDFMGVGSYIDESKYIKPVTLAVNKRENASNFNF
jgi:radical SAM superfamily enzyme YgiQ (UPF0313 family)